MRIVMKDKVDKYKKFKQLKGTCCYVFLGCVFLALRLLTSDEFSAKGFIAFFLTLFILIIVCVFLIVSRNLNLLSYQIAYDLSKIYTNKVDLKEQLLKIGFSKKTLSKYIDSVFVCNRNVNTTINTGAQRSKFVYENTINVYPVKCNRCGSDKFHWIEYEKTKYNLIVYAVIVASILGIEVSPIVTICAIILGIVTGIVRISEDRKAKKVNRYQCDMCGNVFELPKR